MTASEVTAALIRKGLTREYAQHIALTYRPFTAFGAFWITDEANFRSYRLGFGGIYVQS